MAELKTKPTHASVAAFLKQVDDDARRGDTAPCPGGPRSPASERPGGGDLRGALAEPELPGSGR